MRGDVLAYDPARGEGLISGREGKRYSFKGTEFKGDVLNCRPGFAVDFVVGEDGAATSVYPLTGAATAASKEDGTILGIISIICAVLGFPIPFILSVAALVCGIVGKSKAKMAGNATGVTLNWIGIALSLITIVFWAIICLAMVLFGITLLGGLSML
jgi:hypothetical protein